MERINRLKVVLAEQQKQINGLLNNSERIVQQYQNGVQIRRNQI